MNQYGYVFGNPANGTDRFGLNKDACDDTDDPSCRKYASYAESWTLTVTAFVSALPTLMDLLWATNPFPRPSTGRNDTDTHNGNGRGTCTGTCTDKEEPKKEEPPVVTPPVPKDPKHRKKRNPISDLFKNGACAVAGAGVDLNVSFPVVPFGIPVGSVVVPAALGFTGGLQFSPEGITPYAGGALQVFPGRAISVQRMSASPSPGFAYGVGGAPLPTGPSGQLNITPAQGGQRGSISHQEGVTFGSRGAYVGATMAFETVRVPLPLPSCR
jgi:hypothetical protein